MKSLVLSAILVPAAALLCGGCGEPDAYSFSTGNGQTQVGVVETNTAHADDAVIVTESGSTTRDKIIDVRILSPVATDKDRADPSCAALADLFVNHAELKNILHEAFALAAPETVEPVMVVSDIEPVAAGPHGLFRITSPEFDDVAVKLNACDSFLRALTAGGPHRGFLVTVLLDGSRPVLSETVSLTEDD